MLRIIFAFTCFWMALMCTQAQNTIGVLFNSDEAYDGYTLYSPVQYTSTYLINNCGNVINQWDSEYSPGLGTYLLDDGRLLRTGRKTNSGFPSAGAGGFLQIFNWDGSLAWEAEVSDDVFGAHHDIEPTSYGTVLLSRWERKSLEDYIQAGKNPDRIPANLWMPSIVEIMPTTMGSFDIVWEWHLFDHLVQDIDPSKDNFGIISENPRKVDINYDEITSSDWAHCNGLSLDEERDEIVLSVRNFDEVWVIDHSTSISEAASDTGGDKGFGGQLLYRFGNDRTYLDNNDQIFDGQHDAKFITNGDGDLVLQVFNNNNSTDKVSEIVEVKPLVDEDGDFILRDGRFHISGEPWILTSTDSLDFDSRIMSTVQTLPNGNLLINSGNTSKFFELNSDGELVWNYKGPVSLFGPNEQGDLINGATFNLIKYPIDDPRFDGLDTSIKAEAIELNPNLVNCGIVSNYNIVEFDFEVYPTLFDQELILKNNEGSSLQVECYDLMGAHMFDGTVHSSLVINTSNWLPRFYFLKIIKENSSQTFKLIKAN